MQSNTINIPNMMQLAGITKESRKKLALLIKNIKYSFTVNEAANILETNNKIASRILSRFVNNGWLLRLKQGVYIILPIEVSDTQAIIEDSWIIADKLFSPCYIGGWSALEYWHLTEQIFNTTIVITTKKIRNLSQEIEGSKFQIKVSYSKNTLGLKPVWRGDIKVLVSDPTRSIIDILDEPKLAGGIRPVLDALRIYLASEHKNIDLFIQYASNAKNKTINKRLGFLIEYLKAKEPKLILWCKEHLSSGNSKLDSDLGADRLIKKWHLWVPNDWKTEWKRIDKNDS